MDVVDRLDDGREHCRSGWQYGEDDEEDGRAAPCTDVDAGGECVQCECCCESLAMLYGPPNGMLLTEEQRAPIAELAKEYGP